MEEANQDLVKAYEEEAKVANTALYLVMGMMVTFSGVGFVLFKIWKKKRDDYYNMDYDPEGGCKDDYYMVMS